MSKKGIDIRLTGDEETVKKIAGALGLKVYENDYGGARVYFKATPDDEAVNSICNALEIANVLDGVEGYKEARKEAREKRPPAKTKVKI